MKRSLHPTDGQPRRTLCRAALLALVVLTAGCGHSSALSVDAARVEAPKAPNADGAALEAVRAVHGGAGPWAVAGYRMGEFALRRLGLSRGSFDLEVEHHSPREVQYSCIADGAAAATGASAGKLNLSLVEAARADLHTVYRRKSNGATLSLRITSGFKGRYLDVKPARLPEAGREVLHLTDEEIFEVVP